MCLYIVVAIWYIVSRFYTIYIIGPKPITLPSHCLLLISRYDQKYLTSSMLLSLIKTYPNLKYLIN